MSSGAHYAHGTNARMRMRGAVPLNGGMSNTPKPLGFPLASPYVRLSTAHP